MISIRDYFGPHKAPTAALVSAAKTLLSPVNALLAEAIRAGVELARNPATGTLVSGQTYGGFRPENCPIGSPKSAHKQARAVDVYDPDGALDAWVTDEILAGYGLYREHPDATSGWCHLTDRAPDSGKRTFRP